MDTEDFIVYTYRKGEHMLALFVGPGPWGVGEFIIALIIVAAMIGILYIALQQFGIKIPGFVIQIFWVLLCAVLAVLAVRFLMSL